MTTDREAGSPYGIRGFPTLKFFGADKSNPIDFQGKRDTETLVKFAREKAAEALRQIETGEIP